MSNWIIENDPIYAMGQPELVKNMWAWIEPGPIKGGPPRKPKRDMEVRCV